MTALDDAPATPTTARSEETWVAICPLDRVSVGRGVAAGHHLHTAPAVGERIGLGLPHPCTTFDKWRWLAVVDADYTVVDAVTTCF